MEDKRRHKRLELGVSLQLGRLDAGDNTTVRHVSVKIADLSRTGMGFTSEQELEIGSYYHVKVQIWTKEIIETVIEIVRRKPLENGYFYGSRFIGMMETDALKIDIYGMLNEVSQKK